MHEITDADYEHWTRHGYVVVPLIDGDELQAVLDNIYAYLPSWDDYAAHRPRYQHLADLGATRHTFPFAGSALNAVSVHPALVAFAERALRTKRLMINESQLIGKYATNGDFEQDLHVDYGNTTLVYPPPDTEMIDLPMITYYTDVTIDLGPTYLVPRDQATNGVLSPRSRRRNDHADLYGREIAITVPAGSVLIYSMNTWHRGSAMTAHAGARFSHHMGFRRIDAPWCGQFTFVHEGGRQEMDVFLTTATPRQRELVGFPPVGDPYWNDYTIAGVAARYPAMDMAPYQTDRNMNDRNMP
jgi:hypothetical protein